MILERARKGGELFLGSMFDGLGFPRHNEPSYTRQRPLDGTDLRKHAKADRGAAARGGGTWETRNRKVAANASTASQLLPSSRPEHRQEWGRISECSRPYIRCSIVEHSHRGLNPNLRSQPIHHGLISEGLPVTWLWSLAYWFHDDNGVVFCRVLLIWIQFPSSETLDCLFASRNGLVVMHNGRVRTPHDALTLTSGFRPTFTGH